MVTAQLEGVDNMLKNLDAINGVLAGRAPVAMFRAGLFVQRESQQIVPVDTGALKNSARTRVVGTGWGTAAVVEYLQAYAIYVHENLNAKHAPGKTAKYVEIILKTRIAEIRGIIEKTLKG